MNLIPRSRNNQYFCHSSSGFPGRVRINLTLVLIGMVSNTFQLESYLHGPYNTPVTGLVTGSWSRYPPSTIHQNPRTNDGPGVKGVRGSSSLPELWYLIMILWRQSWRFRGYCEETLPLLFPRDNIVPLSIGCPKVYSRIDSFINQITSTDLHTRPHNEVKKVRVTNYSIQ